MDSVKMPTVQRVSVAISEIKPGDVVYLSTKPDSPAYNVIDIGAPFMLIENSRTHFCNLYRATSNLYKEICQ